MAVYDHLVSRSHVYPGQLFVVGHGANHPVVSNGTAAGKQHGNSASSWLSIPTASPAGRITACRSKP